MFGFLPGELRIIILADGFAQYFKGFPVFNRLKIFHAGVGDQRIHLAVRAAGERRVIPEENTPIFSSERICALSVSIPLVKYWPSSS